MNDHGQHGASFSDCQMQVSDWGARCAFAGHRRKPDTQLDLILDYRSNLALYPDFQSYFRKHRPPLLAAWGRHYPAFLPAGAIAYQRDLPDAEVHLLDAGHFALETHHNAIATMIRDFLGRTLSDKRRKTQND